MPDFDLAVIGAGAAGLSVTAVAAQLGIRVALIERDRMGGDCLNFGCVPSKALLAASHAMRAIRRAARFGIIAPDPVADWDMVRPVPDRLGHDRRHVGQLLGDGRDQRRRHGRPVLLEHRGQRRRRRFGRHRDLVADVDRHLG